MLERIPQSLALRLGAFYALFFSVGAALVFGSLYYFLADALEGRERNAVEKWAEDYAHIYERGGAVALRTKLNAAETSPEVNSLLVRIIGSGGDITFARVPPDWIETQVQQIPLPGSLGKIQVQQVVQSVRIPKDAEKDFTIANRTLFDGRQLQVARSTDNQTVLLAPLRRTFLTVGFPALAISALGGMLLAWRSTKPLRAVSDTANRIVTTGDLQARVPEPRGGGELAGLVRLFNTVLEKNSTLINAQREALDNLAHDLRTPLTRLRGTAELALQGHEDPEKTREALADCVEEAERIQRLLETMLDVSAAENGTLPLHKERIDLRDTLREAADLYSEVAEEKAIRLSIEAPEAVYAEADPLRLGQAVANLLDNALKYSPSGESVTLSLRKEQEDAVLAVSDTGPGVPPEEREKIWRRLYRGDRSRSQRGLGLGLSLVKAITLAHGGSISLEENQPQGARFVLRLHASPA